MSANYKTLSAFEVATAEEAQSYFMDQAIIKVDTATDLSGLPVDVKTAYVMDTGILMARNVADAWVPMGGVASVGESAPSNPQVGQLWVKPSEVLPLPVRASLFSSATPTATSWTDVSGGSTASITLTKAALVHVSYHVTHACTGSGTWYGRTRVAWTGAAASNSYDHLGGWHGATSTSTATYSHGNLSFHVALPSGTTTFKAQTINTSGVTFNLASGGIELVAVGWADAYTDGVS